MEFEWYEKKNRINIEKHGISFDNSLTIFEGDFLTVKSSYPYEERYLAIGMLEDGEITVIYTIRNDCVRIISARSAKQKEKILLQLKRKELENE